MVLAGGFALLFIRFYFFFSSRRRHTRFSRDWSSDVCSSDLNAQILALDLSEPLDEAAAVRIGALDDPDLSVSLREYFVGFPSDSSSLQLLERSEERRVGKECRFKWSPASRHK